MSYNCLDFLKEAIQSIQTFVERECEIIVVDNASMDGTVEFLPKAFPKLTFIPNPKNVGFSAANNQGFRVAKGQYVLLLNPDAKLINNELNEALVYVEKSQNIILGPKILNPDFSLQSSIIAFPGIFPIFLESIFLSYFFRNAVPKNPYALSGACLLMHRSLYEKLGGLDENLFWMDDVDFCYRAKQQSMSCLYFEKWSIVHHIGQSSKKNLGVVIANQLISKIKFFKKHRQYLNYFLSILLTQVHVFLRLLLFLILTPFASRHLVKFKAYLFAQKMIFKYIFTLQKNIF